MSHDRRFGKSRWGRSQKSEVQWAIVLCTRYANALCVERSDCSFSDDEGRSSLQDDESHPVTTHLLTLTLRLRRRRNGDLSVMMCWVGRTAVRPYRGVNRELLHHLVTPHLLTLALRFCRRRNGDRSHDIDTTRFKAIANHGELRIIHIGDRLFYCAAVSVRIAAALLCNLLCNLPVGKILSGLNLCENFGQGLH